MLIQLDENNGNLTVRRMAENFLYPKAVFMIYLLISNPSFQLEIRNRKNDDYRIFPNNNAGTGHTKVIAPLLKKERQMDR